MGAASLTSSTVLAALSSPPVFVGCVILTYFLYEKRDNKFFNQSLRTWMTIFIALIVLSGAIRVTGLGSISELFRIGQRPHGLVNTGLTLAGNSYRVIPHHLEANRTLRVMVNVTGLGTVNTLMLNASEYEQFQSGSFNLTPLYFANSSYSGVDWANFTLTTPSNGSYYLLLGTGSLLSGQGKSGHQVNLQLRSYVLGPD